MLGCAVVTIILEESAVVVSLILGSAALCVIGGVFVILKITKHRNQQLEQKRLSKYDRSRRENDRTGEKSELQTR